VLKVRNGTAYPMTRLDATVLLPPKGAPLVDSAGRTLNGGQRLPVPERTNKQTWRRGVYNPMAVAYPARFVLFVAFVLFVFVVCCSSRDLSSLFIWSWAVTVA